VPLTALATDDDAVIATVDGRPIRASDVALQARARGSSARVALDDLVTAEALVSEAARRRLDRDRDALDAARARAVRRLLAVAFESETTPDKLPARDIRRYYNAHVNQYDHSLWVDVWHILVPVDKNADAAARAAARAIAGELATKAKGIGDADAFKALAAAATPPPGQAFKVEQILTARDGWVEKPFSYAAFDQLKQPGDTSTVVETSYGYHVIYLNRYIPAVHLTIAEATPQILPALFPPWQRHELMLFLDDAKSHHHVEVHAERLP
jgi:hypothetical protein